MPNDIYRLNTKIRLTMLCLSDFELYSRWMHAPVYGNVPMIYIPGPI